jgi:hypothetical protein
MKKEEIEQLQLKYRELKGWNPREAAEYAYACAVLAGREGKKQTAETWAHAALLELKKCSTETLEDCTARNIEIAGIGIPGIFHEDVVKFRMKEFFGINLAA